MLKTRVITAIIVAPLALAALLLLEPTPFRAFIAIVLESALGNGLTLLIFSSLGV